MNDFFNKLRIKEFGRLDQNNQIYLDYTGGNLYPDSLINKHQKLLKNSVFGNPHSFNPTSLTSTKLCEEARQSVLDYFSAKDYYCVFTLNASHALQIVGESFPFNEKSHFLLFSDNHNSVNGIREFCRSKKGTYSYSKINVEDLRINKIELENQLNDYSDKENKLFAFPAQSNVSGVKHSLEWINVAQKKSWYVLLDAAAFVPTSKLDLSLYKPDFVSISFYKIFGYPTGVGCLLIKKSSFHVLKKPWFAGGTVSFASVSEPTYYLHENHEKFENGTINYLSIPAVKFGVEFIESIGIDNINQHVGSLTNYLLNQLKKLKHQNGQELIHIFGPKDLEDRGGTVIFNIENKNNNHYPFEEVEKLANSANISLRTGCFCNPGIDEINHCVSHDDLLIFFTSLSNDDVLDLVKKLKRIRGAIRVSLGIASNKEDIDKLIQFLKSFLE
ncbi:MAG: aminotransferase class V-fold PLP-dependent enzyme [Flavobacteriia bacterium]|nr:aminotransferase class V-fold PLP-dependent enzyme [Flavobacteriia bacterium]